MDKSQLHSYQLIIAYDGRDFSGWQIQPNASSIQELMESALKTICTQEIKITASGRTDAGVHALGQAAHIRLEKEWEPKRLLMSLNGLLPHTIRVKSIKKVSNEFHARYSAIAKTYHYHLWLDPVQDPFNRAYSLHIYRILDLMKLQVAAKLFVGTHDFTSFSNASSEGACKKNPVRTIKRLDLIEQKGGWRIEIEGNGFLYKMVRNIVGTLLEVATGKRSIESVIELFALKDRRRAGKAAPPHGLFLMSVLYP